MLGKCLKYDLKAVGGYWWIAAVSVLALSLPGGYCLRRLVENIADAVSDYNPIWDILLLMLVYVALAAFSIVSIILIYLRYYRNFFTDEGYLTFTLPVKRKTLLGAKLINACIWSMATGLVTIACVCIMLAATPMEDTNLLAYAVQVVWNGLFRDILLPELGWWMAAYAVELLLVIVAATVMEMLITHLAITIAAIIAKKHKVLAAVGLMYGFNAVLSIVYSIGSSLLSLWFNAYLELYPNGPADATAGPIIALILLLIAAVIGTASVALWKCTLACLERKLNLA